MAFNSVAFLIFLPPVLAAWHLIPSLVGARTFLLVASPERLRGRAARGFPCRSGSAEHGKQYAEGKKQRKSLGIGIETRGYGAEVACAEVCPNQRHRIMREQATEHHAGGGAQHADDGALGNELERERDPRHADHPQ